MFSWQFPGWHEGCPWLSACFLQSLPPSQEKVLGTSPPAWKARCPTDLLRRRPSVYFHPLRLPSTPPSVCSDLCLSLMVWGSGPFAATPCHLLGMLGLCTVELGSRWDRSEDAERRSWPLFPKAGLSFLCYPQGLRILGCLAR